MSRPAASPVDLSRFESEARAFLERSAVPKRRDPIAGPEGESDSVALFEEFGAPGDAGRIAATKDWLAMRFDAGFGWIDGPSEYGGGGLTGQHRRRYRQLEAEYLVPDDAILMVGVAMVAPTVLVHGTDTAKREYLRALHRGDLLACQLFSEPDAGSDLGAIRTTARRDSDEWVVTGQKLWTSNAHLADIGYLLCATGRRATAGRPELTAFLIDMASPGVVVRPIRQMTGGFGFAEVYLDDVRVPDGRRLGNAGEGWRVAMTTLAAERASIGSGMGLGPGPGPCEGLVELLHRFVTDRAPVLRQTLVRLSSTEKTLDWFARRATVPVEDGVRPGPELTAVKLGHTRHLAEISSFVTGVLGPRLAADTGEWGTFAWSEYACGVPGSRLGGGSDEMLLNTIGERVLGLPREPTQATGRHLPGPDTHLLTKDETT